jgi:hypothetical protein
MDLPFELIPRKRASIRAVDGDLVIVHTLADIRRRFDTTLGVRAGRLEDAAHSG